MPAPRPIRVWLRDLGVRHEPAIPLKYNLKAGLGALLSILLLGWLLQRTGLPLLIAPLGASAILLFGRPTGVLAQPLNVVSGYGIAVITAYLAFRVVPNELWATAGAIGVTLVLMRLFRVTHPPAGAIPLIALAEAQRIGDVFVGIIVGGVILILMALLWHHLPPRQPYPRRVEREAGSGRLRRITEDDVEN